MLCIRWYTHILSDVCSCVPVRRYRMKSVLVALLKLIGLLLVLLMKAAAGGTVIAFSVGIVIGSLALRLLVCAAAGGLAGYALQLLPQYVPSLDLTSIFSQTAFKDASLWQLGAVIGFIGGCFKSKLSVTKEAVAKKEGGFRGLDDLLDDSYDPAPRRPRFLTRGR